MQKREKEARAFIKREAHFGKQAKAIPVLAAGLLAGLRACNYERNKYSGAIYIAATCDIRDAILDALEKANGGPL